MDFVSLSIAVFFLVLAYIVFQKYIGDEPEQLDGNPTALTADAGVSVAPANTEGIPDEKVSETIYTQDYYPWWRSTRWWNYDGWLYQKP